MDAESGSHGEGSGRVAPRKTLADPAMEDVGVERCCRGCRKAATAKAVAEKCPEKKAGDERREISSSCVLGDDAGDEAGQQGKMLVTRLETKRETRRARLGTILETSQKLASLTNRGMVPASKKTLEGTAWLR